MSAHFVRIGNTNTLGPITCKDMFEFTMSTKTRMTLCCGKSLPKGQTDQAAVVEGEEPPLELNSLAVNIPTLVWFPFSFLSPSSVSVWFDDSVG